MTYRVGAMALAALSIAAPLSPDASTPVRDQAVANRSVAQSANRLELAGMQRFGPIETEGVAVSACMAGLDSPATLDFVGETARVIGDLFATFESEQSGEIASVSVIVVDDASAPDLDWSIQLLGDPATADCREAEITVPESADGPSTLVDVVATSGLGIGDTSARLDTRLEIVEDGEVTLQLTYTYAVARTGRALAVVSWILSGPERITEFDAQEELASLVASLDVATSSSDPIG